MTELTLAILGGAAGAALVTGVMSIIMYRMKRKDEQNDSKDAMAKALRYLMLYIIQERAKDHIRAQEISLEDLRLLHHWHNLYHDGLGGNGDADALIEQVERLKITTD